MGKTNPIQFMRQVKQEVKKVTWPTKGDVVRATLMVLSIVAVATLFFSIVDWIFGSIIQWIFRQ